MSDNVNIRIWEWFTGPDDSAASAEPTPGKSSDDPTAAAPSAADPSDSNSAPSASSDSDTSDEVEGSGTNQTPVVQEVFPSREVEKEAHADYSPETAGSGRSYTSLVRMNTNGVVGRVDAEYFVPAGFSTFRAILGASRHNELGQTFNVGIYFDGVLQTTYDVSYKSDIQIALQVPPGATVITLTNQAYDRYGYGSVIFGNARFTRP